MIKIIPYTGSSMIARSIAANYYSFTTLKVGVGIVIAEENPYDFVGLKTQVKSTDINSFKILNENLIQIEAIYSNEGFETSKAITEYGIYAKIGEEEEKLYCYMCRPELPENVPAFSSDTYTKKIKRFRLEIGTADNVTVLVDDSITYVTHEFLENALALKSDTIELQKIKDYLGLENLQSALGYSYLGEFYLG